MAGPVVLVHGGAGLFDDERVQRCIEACERAAKAGMDAIADGALEAVVAAVKVLEQDPDLNAGLGATLTSEGTVELDAAVMTGDLRFGAVAACPPVASAVELARQVMLEGSHTMLAAHGAVDLAKRAGVPLLGPEDLIVPRVRAAWEAEAEGRGLTPYKAGTVGAVACDIEGGLAAATSTGGILFKLPGRVGDTPLPGGGTYADGERRTAASATGEGEAIMRVLLCREVADLVAGGSSIADAVNLAMKALEDRTGGKAGVIAAASDGSWSFSFNTKYMPWAAVEADGSVSSGAG